MAGKDRMTDETKAIQERQREIDDWLRERLGGALEISTTPTAGRYRLDGEPATQQEVTYAAIKAQGAAPGKATTLAQAEAPDAPDEGRLAEPPGEVERDSARAPAAASAGSELGTRSHVQTDLSADRRPRDAEGRVPPRDEGLAVDDDRPGPRPGDRHGAGKVLARGPLIPPEEGYQPPSDAALGHPPQPSIGPLFAFFSWGEIVERIVPIVGKRNALTTVQAYDVDHEAGELGVVFRFTKKGRIT